MSTETFAANATTGCAGSQPPTFQDIVMNLQHYWAAQGCVVLQPYDGAVGAGTNHTATTLRSLGPDTWRTCYVQGCRRPTDGRYGENPNRLQYYYSSRCSRSPARTTSRTCTWGASAPSASIRTSMTCASSRTTGSRPRSAHGALAGRCGSTAWRVTQFTWLPAGGRLRCAPVPVEIALRP